VQIVSRMHYKMLVLPYTAGLWALWG